MAPAFSSTECPASLTGTRHAAYMADAQYWYDHQHRDRARYLQLGDGSSRI
ncbi:hypothetical protein [Nanchangia anserum]|uniref:hypothetical protein n=1 Tax=Nanchangia anserum TaxID=2692125 RepID=UPI001CC6A52C|nr:hypothetical protein [Nanchangia anserum]